MSLKQTYTLKLSTTSLTDIFFIEKIFFLILNNIKVKTIFLPNKKKKFTLIRSPHVNKKSKEHFQITKHNRLYLVAFSKEQLEFFLQKIPNNVEIKIKKYNIKKKN